MPEAPLGDQAASPPWHLVGHRTCFPKDEVRRDVDPDGQKDTGANQEDDLGVANQAPSAATGAVIPHPNTEEAWPNWYDKTGVNAGAHFPFPYVFPLYAHIKPFQRPHTV